MRTVLSPERRCGIVCTLRARNQPGKAAGSEAVNLTPLAFFAAAPVSVLIATFFKIGLVFFGGGFVLIPVLHNRLVIQLGWLKPQEFLDGVAISNLTPGPIAVLATFAGFHLAGTIGALAANRCSSKGGFRQDAGTLASRTAQRVEPLACCLKTFCGVAKVSLGRALRCGPVVRKLW
jgi:hypothetical protein